MSERQRRELNFLIQLETAETRPVKKQGRIAKRYKRIHEHYLTVIDELNIQRMNHKLALEIIVSLLEMISEAHPLFF